MVIKIQKGAETCRGPVGYNERKVASGEAHVIGVSNMDGNSIATVLRTFDQYEKNPAISAKAGNLAFHMTVNPGKGEQLSDEKAMEMIHEIMQGLGYGEQPFIVYRHNDIDREHFHVVSVRADKEGKIISNSHERRILQRLMNELGPMYGFVNGKEKKNAARVNLTIPPLTRFDPDKGDHANQVKAIFSQCRSYCFTSERQLEQLLGHFGVRIIRKNAPEGERLYLQGLDSKGKPYGVPLSGRDLGMDFRKAIDMSLNSGMQSHPMKRQEKARVAGVVRSCFEYSTSRLHFERMLEKKGITPLFSRREDGQIFGAAFLDHNGRCVFKCSELGEGISAALFRDAESSGKWKDISLPIHTPTEAVISSSEEHNEHPQETHSAILDNLGTGEKSRERDIRKKKKRRKGITL